MQFVSAWPLSAAQGGCICLVCGCISPKTKTRTIFVLLSRCGYLICRPSCFPPAVQSQSQSQRTGNGRLGGRISAVSEFYDWIQFHAGESHPKFIITLFYF